MIEGEVLEAIYVELLMAVRGAIKVTEKLMKSSNEEVRLAAVNHLLSLTNTAAQLVETLDEPTRAGEGGSNPLARRLRSV